MTHSALNRTATLVYGVTCYAVFFASFLYLVGFLANAGVPKSIDSGSGLAWPAAVAINLGLLAVFALQHSAMARPAFKRAWTRIVPRSAERSTYVLFTVAALVLLVAGWQPLPHVLFRIEDEAARAAIYGVFGLGVGLVLYSTCLIDHFDLFGLRQVVLHFRGRPYEEKSFVTPSLYRHIRHPLYVGWFVAFWATPDMTVGHLLFAAVNTAYVLVAIVYEERDLGNALGEEYLEYRERTPKFVPRIPERVREQAPQAS